jgi:enoyl-CoA hydratase/carnithine racemase
MPPYSVAGVLQSVVGAEHASLKDALAVERQAVHKASSGKHQMEGMMAFLEKRPADFSTEPD